MRLMGLIGLVIAFALCALAVVSTMLKRPPAIVEAERRGMATRKTTTGVGTIMPEARRAVVERGPSFFEKIKAAFLFALVDQTGSLNLQTIRDDIAALTGKAEAIQAKADAEKRELTAAENTQFEGFLDAVDSKKAELKRRERLEASVAELGAPGERRSKPQDAVRDDEPRISGGDSVASKTGTFGFRNFGEFAMKVRQAARKQNPIIDKRLIDGPQNAATTYGSEGVGADGGYTVPPDFRQQMLTKVFADESLLARCFQINSESNDVVFPADEDEPWSTTGGIQVYWVGEAGAPTQSKPALRGLSVHAEKMAALVPVTDELLADSAALQGWLTEKAAAKIAFKVNDAILNGSGAGKPQGILKSAALITIAKESGQTAGTVLYNNITKMWRAMRPANRRNAIWIANQDVESQLYALTLPGAAAAGIPVFLPANGLSDSPLDKLLGRPIIYSEATAALGTPGDLVLADLTQYVALVKGGGMRTDISIHLWFDQDVTAFRFILRIGGKPWWSKTITRTGSKQAQSAYVAMDSTT